MFNTILILGLLNLSEITISLHFCEPDNTGLNKCHDGGCNNNVYDQENICLCSFSRNIMNGRYCGIYEDKCTINPCANNGKCISGIGYYVCECSNEFYGINCEIPIKKNDTSSKIRRPSLFYRIKSKHGEELHLLLIANTFGDVNYNVMIRGTLSNFRYKLNHYKKKMKISDAINLCSTKLDSEEFKINNCYGPDNYDCQNMCNLIPKLYGYDSEVEIALIGPYFNTKTSLKREDIYYDLYNTTRMGGKYTLEVQLYTTNENNIEYKIDFIQFIVDDITSLCLPVMEYFSYTKQDTVLTKELRERSIETVFRNISWTMKVKFVLKRLCPSRIEDIQQIVLWKIFDNNKIINSYINEKGVPYLDGNLMYLNDLFIDRYKLPMGIHIFFFQIILINKITGFRTADFYLRYIDIQLQELVAKISGPSPLYLGNNLLTLDASESYNPNEKDVKKHLLYTWECNIPTDDICKKSTSTNSRLIMNRRLSEAGGYTFTLTLSVDNNYISTIGKPNDGITKIIVYHDPPKTTTLITSSTALTSPTPTIQTTLKSTTQTHTSLKPTTQISIRPTTQTSLKTTTQTSTKTTLKPTISTSSKPTISTSSKIPEKNKKEISIKCIKNCMPLSNPSNNLHLEAKLNFKGNKFEWYYQFNDINIKPVDDIALTDVPTHILIIKRNKLEYGKVYTFIVKYPKYTLMNNLSVTTVSKPKIGNCTIQPLFGLAGETLFTIACIHLSNKNTFEYYQKNKNYEASRGVLLDRGKRPMTDFKLTSSNDLIIRVINTYGAYSQTHLSVNVSECNTHLLNTLYNELNMHLKNKDISKAVSIISILSDVLRDNHINEFKKLFKTLNKIPLFNCISQNIFCIDQFVLILQKVIKDYYSIHKDIKEVTELLKIAKQLLKIAMALLEYIKSSNEYYIMIEINKIEEIKRILRENIIFIVNNIVYNNTNTDNSERYLWSSFENWNKITQKIDYLIKSFGKSVILNIKSYKRKITCVDNDFKSCVLLPGWLKNRSSQLESKSFLYDYIEESLADELLLKGGNVGITIFHVGKNLMETFNEIKGIQIVMPIVSLDLLHFDQSKSKNIITYKSFDNYINLNFKNNDTTERQKQNYSVQVLTQNSNSIKSDKNILVYRIDMKNIRELFVTLSDSTHDLRFTWLRDKRPDIKLMKNSKYAVNLKAGEDNEFTLKTLDQYQNKIHYIGVSAITATEQTTRSNVIYANFSMIMFSPQCMYWTGIKWAPDGIIVGSKTTENNIHCQTNHSSLFSSFFYTLPDVADTIEGINHADSIINNMVCVITVLVIFLIYTTLFIWSKHQDKKDVSRGEIVILHDNYPGEDEVYLVTVYTGDFADAGTTANVCFQLHGNISNSRVHWLYNSNCDVLQRFNDDWFIVFTPKSLGELKSIHIWHDNYGNNPNWYCKRIEVTDVRKRKKWNFNVERWFTILNSIENIEHSIFIGTTNDWHIKAIDDVRLTIREEYLWASVFIRHPRSLITRCQKLSRIICLLFSAMVISILFYDFVDEPWWRKLLAKIVPREVIYLPAQMEEKNNKNTGINYWLLAGWTLCLLIYGLSTFLIITFGLKLGQVKSLHWLMALLITVLQNALISEPLQIIICSYIIFKLNQGQHHILLNNYTISLDNFRKNTKNRLQNIQFVQSIRERRKRYVYSPMTRKSAQILQAKYKDKLRHASFQENVATCLLLILISLFCISALYSFSNPKHIMHANKINKLFLKSILQTNIMDLEMMKAFLTGSFLNPFHIREYYNGIPIVNKSMPYLSEDNIRGWCSFYNSKLVNGGIRLKQNRITEKNSGWESDTGSYKEGWIKITNVEKVTAWIYRSIPVIKYFGLWFPDTKNSGFILDLTGQLSDYKKKINTHLENGWLDNKTRILIIEFHTYTPSIDCITVFKIKFQTLSGLLYTIHSEVWTVPSSSAIVTWNTYVFTLVFMLAYALTAVRLMVSLRHMVSAMYDHGGGAYRLLCAAYECAVLMVVMCAIFAVTGRWKLMELAHEQYASAREIAIVSSMTYMCQTHEHVAALASVTVAMGLFRTFQLVMYETRVSHVARALGASVRPTAAVAAYSLIVTYGAWSSVTGGDGSGFFNAFVLARAGGRDDPLRTPLMATAASAAVFLLLNAAVVSIITKRYVLSKLYTRQ